jgi:hypothetical protein
MAALNATSESARRSRSTNAGKRIDVADTVAQQARSNDLGRLVMARTAFRCS